MTQGKIQAGERPSAFYLRAVFINNSRYQMNMKNIFHIHFFILKNDLQKYIFIDNIFYFSPGIKFELRFEEVLLRIIQWDAYKNHERQHF